LEAIESIAALNEKRQPDWALSTKIADIDN
jgi:hypothetical protein